MVAVTKLEDLMNNACERKKNKITFSAMIFSNENSKISDNMTNKKIKISNCFSTSAA